MHSRYMMLMPISAGIRRAENKKDAGNTKPKCFRYFTIPVPFWTGYFFIFLSAACEASSKEVIYTGPDVGVRYIGVSESNEVKYT